MYNKPRSSESRKFPPSLAILLTLLFFGILASILYGINQERRLLPEHIVAYSLPFSIIILVISVFVTGQQSKIIPLFTQTTLLPFAGMGFLSPFLYFILITNAFSRLGAIGHTVEAYVLNATWPIFMVLFSIIILKEKLKLRNKIALSMGFLGILYILTNGNLATITLSDWYGDLLAGLAAVVFGLYSALLGLTKMRKLFNDFGAIVVILGFQTFSLIYSWIYLIVTNNLIIPSWPDVGLLALAGAGSFGFGYVFYYFARNNLASTTFAGFMFTLPFGSLLFLGVLSGQWAIREYWIGLFAIGLAVLLQRDDLAEYFHKRMMKLRPISK